jgi:hypothetical protein
MENLELVYEVFGNELIKHMGRDIFHVIDIDCDYCSISITNRPGHCDRGRFLVYIESKDHELKTNKCHIDAADQFPRYYFSLRNAFSEIALWLKKRQIGVIAYHTKNSMDEGYQFPA